MLERDALRARAVQVGMLMRAYRESFQEEGAGRGITQDQLLRRMAEVDGDFAQRYSHTTVSRWESGGTRPSRERLEVFGRALNLSAHEVEGLLLLAGFARSQEPDSPTGSAPVEEPCSVGQSAIVVEQDDAGPIGTGRRPVGGWYQRVHPTLRQGLLSCMLPGMAIIGCAYLLATLGWDESWMPVAYIGGVLGARVALGFRRLSGPYDLCEFFCVSIFFLLTTPLLQSAAVRTDHYGFFTIGDFGGTATPYMFALLVNHLLAAIAGVLFHALQQRQYKTGRLTSNPFRRALSVVLPPIALVYVAVAAITNLSVLAQIGVVFAVLSVVCAILLVLRDPAVAPDDRDRRFLLWSTMSIGMLATTIGTVVVVAVFLAPGIPSVLPDHNLVRSWDVDYSSLGIPEDEVLHRYNTGYLWHASFTFIYMVFIVGTNLVSAIYRWSGGGPFLRDVDTRTPGPGSDTSDGDENDAADALASSGLFPGLQVQPSRHEHDTPE